jgi:hypothetical protein
MNLHGMDQWVHVSNKELLPLNLNRLLVYISGLHCQDHVAPCQALAFTHAHKL